MCAYMCAVKLSLVMRAVAVHVLTPQRVAHSQRSPWPGRVHPAQGLARWSSKSAVALSLVSRTKLDNDLKWAGHRLKHHLTSLHIKCVCVCAYNARAVCVE